MEIKIKEEYPGELEEKKHDLVKALFPNTRAMSTLKVPERKFRDKATRQLHKDLSDKYKAMLSDMWTEIEMKLLEFVGK